MEAPDGVCSGVFSSIWPLRSSFYGLKTLLLFCHWSLTNAQVLGVQSCLIIQPSQCYTPDCNTLSFK